MRNAIYYKVSTRFVHGAGQQVKFEEIFISSIRAAWPYPDDKKLPPAPLDASDEEPYFDDTTPTDADAAQFVCGLFELFGEEVPVYVRARTHVAA